MNKYNINDPYFQELLNDPKVKEILDSPEFKELQKEVNDFISGEYAYIDNADFVGEAIGGLIKATYCRNKKGLYKIDIDDSIYSDKKLVQDAIIAAINSAVGKYVEETKIVEERVVSKEQSVCNELIKIYQNKMSSSGVAVKSSNKSYLN